MKKIKLVLCLVLFVCGVEQAFGQNISEVEKDFKADITKVLLNCYSADRIDSLVNAYCEAYGKEGFDNCGKRLDKYDWKIRANKVFQKCKKELEKLDAKIAKGKEISAEDANKAAILYSLGYAPICAQNYQKAADIYNRMGDDATLPIKFAGKCCLYKVNGDKTPAISLIESIDLKEFEQNNLKQIATRYGLKEDVNTIIKKKNEQTIKRAIRSKNWDLLKSFSDYGIREVDSMLCVDSPQKGESVRVQWEYWKKCREDGYVFGYTQNRKTLIEYITTAKDVFPIFEYDIAKQLIKDVDSYNRYFSSAEVEDISYIAEFDTDPAKRDIAKQLIRDHASYRPFKPGSEEYEILIKTIKNDPYAGLIVGAAQLAYIFCSRETQDFYANNTKKIIQILVKKIPEILTWKDCPLLIKADGTFQIKQPYHENEHGYFDYRVTMAEIVQPIINYCKAHRNKK